MTMTSRLEGFMRGSRGRAVVRRERELSPEHAQVRKKRELSANHLTFSRASRYSRPRLMIQTFRSLVDDAPEAPALIEGDSGRVVTRAALLRRADELAAE